MVCTPYDRLLSSYSRETMLECSRHRRRREPQPAGQRSFAGRSTLRYIHIRRTWTWSPIRRREIRSPSPKTRAPRVIGGSRTCSATSGAFTRFNLLRDPGFSYTMSPFMSGPVVSQMDDLFTSPATHDVSVTVPFREPTRRSFRVLV